MDGSLVKGACRGLWSQAAKGLLHRIHKDSAQGTRKYNQHRENYLNIDFRAKVGKEAPKDLPFPVGKQNVDDSHIQILQRHEKPEIT